VVLGGQESAEAIVAASHGGEGPNTRSRTYTARDGHVGDEAPQLMEEVCARENMQAALKRVVRNGGAPGPDGMTVEGLLPYCREHWAHIREELLSGTYRPEPVRPCSRY
jgi:hypothetical protein